MQGLRYLEDATTLKFNAEKCTGCQVCTIVCPHGVFAMGADKRAHVVDRGACMECGACTLNCAWGAISVDPGVGCASAIIHSWIYGGEPSCGCSTPGAPVADGAACGPTPGASAGGCGSSGASSCCDGGPVAPRELEPRPLTPRPLTPRGTTDSSCGCGSAPAGSAGTGQPPGAS